MFPKPTRFVLALAAIACAALLSSCYPHGESADPPVGGVTAVAGNGQVTLSWQPDSGVEYWLFWAPGTIVDVTHSVITTNVSSPYVVAGLLNGTTYAFAINGRKDGGPGGALTPVVTATPRPSGIEWNIGGAAGTADLKGVAWGTPGGTSTFDTVGVGGALFMSADGITWTPAAGNWAALVGGSNMNAIIYPSAMSRFIAVGDAGLILFSADNTNWTAGAYAAPPVPAPRLNALANDGKRVVAVGDGAAIYYSDDAAVTWTAAAAVPGGTGNLYGVARSSSGSWVAVGAAGTIITSTDGSNWVTATSVSPAITADLRSVAALTFNGVITAVGAGGVVATSSDNAVTWTTEVVTPADLQAVAESVSSNFLFAGVGRGGAAFTSFDGIAWTSRTTGTVSDLFAVVSGNGQFVAVGQAGTTAYSR